MLKWNEQHLTPTQIHEILKDLFEEKSISLSTVSRAIRQLSWTPTKQEPENRSGRPPNYKINMAILECLDSDLYLSCREIAKIIKIDYSSVRYALANRLHFKWHHLRRITHLLTGAMKNKRVECSSQLLHTHR